MVPKIRLTPIYSDSTPTTLFGVTRILLRFHAVLQTAMGGDRSMYLVFDSDSDTPIRSKYPL
jgi:hypothetical protein